MVFGTQTRSPGSRALRTVLVRHSGAALCLLLPGLSVAHTQGAGLVHTHSWSMLSGWAHPFSGLDHLLAMVALGVLAAQRAGRSTWILPIVFIACLAVGGVAGMFGLQAPAVESILIASLLVLGGAIASPARLGGAVLVSIAAGFGAYHGLAHGMEAPAGSVSAAYLCGFLLASAALHCCGFAVVAALRRVATPAAVRVAGAAIAATGLALLLPMAA
jgi:urease accessory protein